jgi:hypothetical protein
MPSFALLLACYGTQNLCKLASAALEKITRDTLPNMMLRKQGKPWLIPASCFDACI